MRAGFPRFTSAGRATAVATACLILDKFAVEPATGKWVLAIQPVHDLLVASLADYDKLPRCAALFEAGRLWVWIPGRSLTPFEEQTLGEWKAAIHKPVIRCLGAGDPETRMAAVACLGNLPIDNAAAAAVRYVSTLGFRWVTASCAMLIEPRTTASHYVGGIGAQATTCCSFGITTDIATDVNEAGFSLTQRFYLRPTEERPCGAG